MFENLIFYLSLVVALVIGFLYFRDLGDITQMLISVKRKNMIRFIRHEYTLLATGLGATVLLAIAHFVFDAGPTWLFWTAIIILLVLYVFPYLWVHAGLRNQRNTASYYPVEEALAVLAPGAPVVVIENNGVARAHPDSHLMHPHYDRLPGKTYVWGIDIGDDAVCFTQDFLVEHGNLANSRIGDRDLVLAWDPVYESLGAWYNDSGFPVTRIDFFGNSDQGTLVRVETLKVGLFWHVWSEFYPHTDINRVST